MGLIACRCPHCGGEVTMDENLVSGFCTYCGNKVINDKAVVGNVKVTMDRTPEVVNTLKLAKHAMFDGDAFLAESLLKKAMEMDSENSDVWYMDAVLDRRHASNNLKRAASYPSLGVFSRDDVKAFKNFNSQSETESIYMIFAILAFFTVFASIPIGIIMEMYWIIPVIIVFWVVIGLVLFAYISRKRRELPPEPTDDKEILSRVGEEIIEKKE